MIGEPVSIILPGEKSAGQDQPANTPDEEQKRFESTSDGNRSISPIQPAPPTPARGSLGHVAGALITDQTICTECDKPFQDPRILRCFHTFCVECLVDHANPASIGMMVTCPTCRFVTSTSGSTQTVGLVHDVSVIDHLRSTLAVNQSAQLRLEGETLYLCAECNSPSTLLCKSCSQTPYCDVCHARTHAPRSLRLHVTERLAPVAQSPSVDTSRDAFEFNNLSLDSKSGDNLLVASTPHCSVHMTEELSLYCQTCNETCCRDCALIGEHKGHDHIAISERAPVARNHLLRWSARLTSALEHVDGVAGAVRKQQVKLIERSAEVSQHVQREFNELHQMLARRQGQLLHELMTVTEIKSNQLDRQLGEVEGLLQRIYMGSQLADALVSSRVDSEVLAMHPVLDERYLELEAELGGMRSVPCTTADLVFVPDPAIAPVVSSTGCVETAFDTPSGRGAT